MNSSGISEAAPTLDLTVAICTWNRAELLRQTLQSLTQLNVPSGLSWEVLVVNNNCTDDTSSVVQSFASSLPIREYFEPTPGKSNALNSGTRTAQGEVIIWTDDDVLVRPEWLQAYADAIAAYPQAEFWGGPVDPWFETTAPAWLDAWWPVVQHAYAVIDYTAEDQPITEKTIPFGVNWAIRRATQLRYLYDGRLGPRPNSTLRGEETTLIRQMLADGVPGFWVTAARMQHFIPRQRMTVEYLKGFYFGQGEGIARITKLGLRDRPRQPLWRLGLVFLKHRLFYEARKRNGPPERVARHLVASSKALGSLVEYWRGEDVSDA